MKGSRPRSQDAMRRLDGKRSCQAGKVKGSRAQARIKFAAAGYPISSSGNTEYKPMTSRGRGANQGSGRVEKVGGWAAAMMAERLRPRNSSARRVGRWIQRIEGALSLAAGGFIAGQALLHLARDGRFFAGTLRWGC